MIRRKEHAGRGAGHPVSVETNRQPLTVAAGFQDEIATFCRRHKHLSPAAFDFLKGRGYLNRVNFLAGEAGGPLLTRYLADDVVRVFGADYARRLIGQPHHEADPYGNYAAALDREYREAIEGSEPILNRIVLFGAGPAPVAYSHLLIGWSLPDGRRAVLSAVECY